MRVDEVVKLIRGPKGTIVKLEILPSSSPAEADGKVIEIKRDLVKLEDQAAKNKLSKSVILKNPISLGLSTCPHFIWTLRDIRK